MLIQPAPSSITGFSPAAGKTLTVNNSITIAGADGETIYPSDWKQCTGSVTKNGSAAYGNVTGLTGFNVVTGSVYEFEFELASTVASGTGGIKYAFNYTNSAALSAIQATGIGYTASAVAVQNMSTTTTQTDIFTQAAVVIFTRLVGTFTCSATGTVDLQMAQNTSNASNTITLIGSAGRITRIG